MLNVTIINGGRGAAALIPVLLSYQTLNLSSVVNAYDDGKSTGEIRRFFGMLGPSDIRKVQQLMLPSNDLDYLNNIKLFQYRFPSDYEYEKINNLILKFIETKDFSIFDINLKNLNVINTLHTFITEFYENLKIIEYINNKKFDYSDCSLMNCIYAGAFLKFSRNIETATLYIEKLFNLRGRVIPTTIENKILVALRENGEMLYSESEIVELRSNVNIEKIFLVDKIPDKLIFDNLDINNKRKYLNNHHCYVAISDYVTSSLNIADIIIYAAGTQHSSLYPTYLTKGFAQSIADNKNALKIFISNIGADYETPSYKASDYIIGAFNYLNLSDNRNYSMNELFDVALFNNSQNFQDNSYVYLDIDKLKNLPVKIILDNFESSQDSGKHNGEKVINLILDLYNSKY